MVPSTISVPGDETVCLSKTQSIQESTTAWWEGKGKGGEKYEEWKKRNYYACLPVLPSPLFAFIHVQNHPCSSCFVVGVGVGGRGYEAMPQQRMPGDGCTMSQEEPEKMRSSGSSHACKRMPPTQNNGGWRKFDARREGEVEFGRSWRRARPCQQPCHSRPFSPPSSNFSFSSSHAPKHKSATCKKQQRNQNGCSETSGRCVYNVAYVQGVLSTSCNVKRNKHRCCPALLAHPSQTSTCHMHESHKKSPT